MPKEIAADIRRSLRNVTSLDYFTLTFRRLPTLANKFRQLRDTGVTMLVGTDSGIPGNFHTDSTWRELDTWVRFGMTPMQAIGAATRWPARFLRKEKDLGTLAPGRLADVIAVRGDVLTHIDLLQRVDVVVKGGQRVK
jgi:imidazolonepropionase-like amidohydrolase